MCPLDILEITVRLGLSTKKGGKMKTITITTQEEVCETCKCPSDRAWKSVKDPRYGEIWNETGVCRQCWTAFLFEEKAKDLEEATVIYRGKF
jgi:hypothetical protein